MSTIHKSWGMYCGVCYDAIAFNVAGGGVPWNACENILVHNVLSCHISDI